MVLSRNLPELKQDLRHIEAEQGRGAEKTGSGCDCRVAGTTTSDEAATEMGDAEAATI